VDDNPNNLLALEMALRSLGQNIVTAQSGDEALKQVLKRDFALILLDVQMPGIDGFETAALIRGRERARHVPIVYLTAGNHGDAQMFKGYSLGAVDYLYKPIVPEILRAKAQAFVDLYKANREVKRQAELLRDAERREHEIEIARAKQEWEADRLREEMENERSLAQTLSQKAEELARTVRERELVEVELRTANNALQTLVQSSPLAIVVLSSNGIVKHWNPAAAGTFGWSAEEAAGRPTDLCSTRAMISSLESSAGFFRERC